MVWSQNVSRARFAARPLRLLLVLGALSGQGCWSRLTTPKESFLYETGGPAPVITAPEYQEELKRLEEKLGPLMYHMTVGTRINVDVYGHGIHETLNIRPDGMVDLPLVGDVKAEGKSIPDFKQEISNLYQPFFQQKPQIIVNTDRDSDLSGGVHAGDVSVLNPRAGGGITGAGVVKISGNEHLSQILAQVNALSTETEWRQIAVIRQSRDHKDSVIILCDLERLIKYGDLRQDLLMKNHDVVFIPIERHTLLQELWVTFSLVAQITSNANTITDYIERVERY
jgi:protein involved in polysaccharide export with SLBB domain